MSRLAVFREFKAINLLSSRYARHGEFEVWDANLHDNAIRPFKCPDVICEGVPDTQSLYPLRECECLGFLSEVPPVQGYCPEQHFHIFGGLLWQATTEELCNGELGCLAGVPRPQEPIVSVSCRGSCGTVGVAYLITYVTEHAGIEVEGPPSHPTPVYAASSKPAPASHITMPPLPADHCIKRVRIYRTESEFEDGTSQMPIVGAEWLLVDEIPTTTLEYLDFEESCTLRYPLTTHDPMAFPAPENITYLARTEDGLVVADKSRLYISVPGQPQFSMEGVVNIEDEIRCVQAIGNTIFVLTDKFPVIVTFRITEGMLSIKRETVHRHLPLTSYKSVSRYDNVIYFASEYSLYSFALSRERPRAISLLSTLMTPHQWKMINPDTVVGTAYEYGYMLSSPELGHAIMMEFGGDGTDTRLLTSLMPISYINAEVMTLDHDGHIIYRQEGKTYRWDWREQVFCDPKELQDSDRRDMCSECCPYKFRFIYDNEGKNHFRVARIEWDECSAYSIFVNFRQEHFCGTQELTDIEVLSSRAFGIPKFTSSQAQSIEVKGCGTITEIRLATAYADLVGGSN